MTSYDEYRETDKAQIEDLLVGHTVAKVSDNALILDDGRRLEFVGHDGGCSCVAGDYELSELNGVDNVITRAEFEDRPSGDDYPDNEPGTYKIFVFADNERINLATFEGSDGNGYYGTGYAIHVYPPKIEGA